MDDKSKVTETTMENFLQNSKFVKIAMKVLIVILGIAIIVLSAVFFFKMVGGALGEGANEAVKTLESAMNGDFESYWSLYPSDYLKNKAVENKSDIYEYKAFVKDEFKEHAKAVKDAHRSFTLEASHSKEVTEKQLELINEDLIEKYGISVRCTEAVSVTLTVTTKRDMRVTTEDHEDFLIGKIDGEWYPLDFDFINLD